MRSSFGTPISAITALKGCPCNLVIPSLMVPAHEATKMPMAATAAERCILVGIGLRTALMLAGFCGRKKQDTAIDRTPLARILLRVIGSPAGDRGFCPFGAVA